uniref:Uncharacterized protein n=1 Tax=Opuntia streptacantha TaxID=393608 RepID=A0A7C9EQ66_OPUST
MQALALSPASLLCSPFISDALFVGRSSISCVGFSCFCCDAASPLLLGIYCCFSSPSLDFDFLGISSLFLRCLLMMVSRDGSYIRIRKTRLEPAPFIVGMGTKN